MAELTWGPPDAEGPGAAAAARVDCDDATTRRANRAWWDAAATEYQVEHGAFLGDADFVWCPEGEVMEHGASAEGDVTVLFVTNKRFRIDYAG